MQPTNATARRQALMRVLGRVQNYPLYRDRDITSAAYTLAEVGALADHVRETWFQLPRSHRIEVLEYAKAVMLLTA
jgi:hypothetical protein